MKKVGLVGKSVSSSCYSRTRLSGNEWSGAGKFSHLSEQNLRAVSPTIFARLVPFRRDFHLLFDPHLSGFDCTLYVLYACDFFFFYSYSRTPNMLVKTAPMIKLELKKIPPAKL